MGQAHWSKRHKPICENARNKEDNLINRMKTDNTTPIKIAGPIEIVSGSGHITGIRWAKSADGQINLQFCRNERYEIIGEGKSIGACGVRQKWEDVPNGH